MIDCQGLSFSQRLSCERISKARKIIETKVIDRILCFALFLLGVDRASISKAINVPPGSVRSIIRALFNGGVSTFEDRRYSSSTFLPRKEEKAPVIDIQKDSNNLVVEFGSAIKMNIPLKNTIQAKTVLLTMVNDGLIAARAASEWLDFSTDHIRLLASVLKAEDANAFIDKRQGQQKEYVFTPETKAEVIQQYVANAAIKKKTSSKALAEDLKARCGLDLSPRSIRLHVEKLGLSKIKQTLPGLIESLKKIPKVDN